MLYDKVNFLKISWASVYQKPIEVIILIVFFYYSVDTKNISLKNMTLRVSTNGHGLHAYVNGKLIGSTILMHLISV